MNVFVCMVMLLEANPGPCYRRHFMNYSLAWLLENPLGLTQDNVTIRLLTLSHAVFRNVFTLNTENLVFLSML